MAPMAQPSESDDRSADRSSWPLVTMNDPPRAGGQGANAGEIDAGVELARLLAVSSLGTPEAKEARLKGSKEAERHLLENVGTACPSATAREIEIDLAVADRLDIRGYAFEAELRYRHLAFNSGLAAVRLATMLEIKGHRDEAWRLYLRAAQLNEPAAMLRLAVICQQRGKKTWALRLLRRAYSLLDNSSQEQIADEVDEACSTRQSPAFGRTLARSIDGHNIDVTFALGSFFYVAAMRPDLARLSYCSALGKGNSLAGVSLLDMKPRSGGFSASYRTGYLHHLLADGLNTEAYRAYDVAPDPDEFALESYSILLQNGQQLASCEALVEAMSSGPRSKAGKDAMERVLLNARAITSIQGFRILGVSSSHKAIQSAADAVCDFTVDEVRRKSPKSGSELINLIWHRVTEELIRVRPETRLNGPNSAGSTVRFGRGEFVPGAGVAARLGIAFARLSDDQARVVTQRVGGFYHQEVADAMNLTIDATRRLTRSGVQDMREIQQGEQIPTPDQLLWDDVESSFTDFSRTVDPDRPRSFYPITGPEGQTPIEGVKGERLDDSE